MQIPNKRLIFSTGIGAGLEYYDFIIYGLLANYIEKIFFPADHSNVGMLKVFSIFALGYIVRPIGGLFFSHLGDRFGRKNIFLITILLAAIATSIIGLLPSYKYIGILAPLILILCRSLQGISYGAEMPGMVTFLMEHANTNRQGLYCGLALSNITLCAALASGSIFFLNKILSQSQMLSFGWRIPFWIGSVLAIGSFFLRKNLVETPAFIKTTKIKWPLYYLIKAYSIQILLGIGISFFSACFIIFGVVLPSYLKQFFNFSMNDIYFYISVGYIGSFFFLILIGWLSDKINRLKLFFWAIIVIILFLFPLFELLNYSKIGLLLFILLYQLIIAIIANCYLPLLTDLFPTQARFTGVAVCYNVVYAVGSLTPLVLLKMISLIHYNITALFFILLACSTLLSIILLSAKK